MNLSHTVLGFGFGFGFAYVMTLSHTVFTLRFLNFPVGVYILCLFINVFFGGERFRLRLLFGF
jgi:hypothetical protein